jgi:diaminopimelate decarboxylase
MQLVSKAGKAHIRGVCCEEIAERYGTPFYLYDLGVLRDRIRRVKGAIGEETELFYAVKANSNLEILKAIRDDVDGLDISSTGEMKQGILAGYDPGRMSFAGPGKTVEELAEAVERGVGVVSVESLREIKDLRRTAQRKGRRAQIALRVNPARLVKEFAIKMGGKPGPFGIDEEDLGGAVRYAMRNEESLELLGIHVYAGTQCMSAEALARNVDDVLGIADRLRSAFGIACRWVNLGGGFGVSYYQEGKELDLGFVGHHIRQAVEQRRVAGNEQRRFVLELGRYLVSEAGMYVTRVVSVKQSRGERYFVLDGGMHHHLAASGNFGSMIRKNYVVRNLSNTERRKAVCHLVGPLCTPLDLMGRSVTVESPRLGELLGFMNSGSYGFTASPLFFLGHETPVELMIEEDSGTRVIRGRRTLTDLN